MFRQLFKTLILSKNVRNDLVNVRAICSAASEDNRTEYNYVKILGKIVTNARTLPNGTKSLIVRTTEDGDTYFNHHVNVKTDEPMSMGQRIYVFGNLSSKQFSLDDGRLRQRLTLKSKYMRLRGHERNIESKDLNNVKILAKITSEIRHTDKYSLFTLASSHTPKGEGRISGVVMTEFHRVIVYDQPALGVARNDIKQFDRVLVDGKVSYMPYKDAAGKTIHGGFIVAQSIQIIN